MARIGQKIDGDILDGAALPDLCLEPLGNLGLLVEKRLSNDTLPDNEVLDRAREWKAGSIHASANSQTNRPNILNRAGYRLGSDRVAIDRELVIAARVAGEGHALGRSGANQGGAAVDGDPTGGRMNRPD